MEDARRRFIIVFVGAAVAAVFGWRNLTAVTQPDLESEMKRSHFIGAKSASTEREAFRKSCAFDGVQHSLVNQVAKVSTAAAPSCLRQEENKITSLLPFFRLQQSFPIRSEELFL